MQNAYIKVQIKRDTAQHFSHSETTLKPVPKSRNETLTESTKHY